MSGSANGIAYLDLAGNRVNWTSKPHDTIYLSGSRFHDIIPMTTLAISALCGLCFFMICIANCCVCCCGRKENRKYLPWGTVWVPILCMIAFFAVDLANRVLHELRTTISSDYLGIDVGIGSLSNIADGLLQTYLIKHSPVDMKRAGWLPRFVMILAVVIYSVLSFATRGTQTWSVVEQISGGGYTTLKYWQDLGSAASGMILLYAIGWTIFAFSFVRHETQRRLRWGVSVLAGSFLSRNVVVFVFVLLYSQYKLHAGYGIQLVFLAFYGLLSVVIWTCILVVAGSHKESASSGGANFTPLQQSTDDERYAQPYYSYAYVPRNV